MSLVLDSSAALAYCFEDERTPQIVAVFARIVEQGAVVPSLWRFEMANVLLLAQRRGRITEPYRQAMFDRFEKASIQMDDQSDALAWRATVVLAEMCNLTVYDAAYLELAQRRRLPLATLDAALARAAKAAGVEVLG